MTNRITQQERILQVLKAANGGWVTLVQIMTPPDGQGRIGQYTARIWDLRQQGYHIENMKEQINGVTHSWYRLVTESQQTLSL
jgi:hypothetical protein